MLRLSCRVRRTNQPPLRWKPTRGFSLRRRYEARACKADSVWRQLRTSFNAVGREQRVRPVWWDLLRDNLDDHRAHRWSAYGDQPHQRRGLPDRTTNPVATSTDHTG